MMRLPARVLALLLAVFPAATLALGLGNVEVQTALNEPLRAEIPITGVRPGEVGAIEVRLGSDEQFRRAGIQRPFYLTRLKFEVVPDGERKARIELTTKESVTEPFLNFLVEINWPSGRMIREYTVLLDPPVYGAAISSSSNQSIARVESVPESSGAPAPRPLPEPQPMAAPEPSPPAAPVAPPKAAAPRVAAPEPPPQRAPARAPSPAPAVPAPTLASVAAPELAGIDRYGPVVANESLWSIAKRVRPDQGISIQRMMFAILEANREAFFLDNINALKKGAVLRIPDRGEIGPDEKALAMAQVKRHQAIWDDYRSRLAGAPPSVAPEGAQAAARGATSAQSPAAGGSEPAARLQLAAAGASPNAGVPGDQTSLAQLREELSMALEDADSKQRENQELSERLGETERIISDLNRMLELKDDEIASLQNQLRQQEGAPVPAPEPEPAVAETMPESAPATTETMPEPAAAVATQPDPAAAAAEPEPAAALEPEAAPAVEPVVAPEPRPKPVLQPPPPAPRQVSYVDQLLSFGDELLNTARSYVPSGVDPVLLAGGLGVLLILGSGLALYRRRQASEGEFEPEAIDFEDDQDSFAASDEDLFRDDSQPEQEEEAGQFADEEIQAVASDAATVESADDDPLSELNIYMAYEHFDQAEDLVRRAIADSPDRHDYRLKLLEVFYAAKNVPAFQQAAGDLRDTVGADSPLFATALGWWEDLAPGQDLFGALQPQGSGPQSSGTGYSDDEVFDVTSGTAGDNEESAVDFDLGFDSIGADETKEDGQVASVDFDLESSVAEEAIPPGAEPNPGVEFDLNGLGGEGDDESGAAGSGDLEFESQRDGGPTAVNADSGGLDFDVSEADEGAASSSALDDSAFDMNLNLETMTEDLSEPEVATKDQGLDFEFDDAKDDVGGGPGLELDSSDGPDTNAEVDADLTEVEKFQGQEGESNASGDDDLGLDFDIGEDLDDGKGAADDLNLAIGMDNDDSLEDSGLDFAIEGDTDEKSSGSSGDAGGGSSDMEFEIGGDDGSEQLGVDSEFDNIFDRSDEKAARDEGASDDDPLGIGGESGNLPELDTDTEDAVELTFLGNEASTDPDDVLADLEFGDEEGDDSDRTEIMLRDVPKPHAGDTDVSVATSSGEGSSGLDDIQTKLDLAEAYIEMGDTDGARGILGEVMNEGSQNQQDQAKDLLQKIG